MPQTDNNEAFLYVTPRSRSFDFIASRTAPFLQFLTFFDGSPYLVLLGGRLSVLGYSLEKYESSAILSAGRQTRKIITFLIAYRQPPPPKQKLTEKSNSLFKNLRIFRKLGTLYKVPNFSNFGKDSFNFRKFLLSNDKTTIRRPKERNANGTSINIETINKLLVSKTTNPGRVHLARKLS